MKMTKPMMKAARSSERTNAGISVVSSTSSLFVGLRLAGQLDQQRHLVRPGGLPHELAQRLDAVVERLRLGLVALEIGLHALLVHRREGRAHDEQAQEQRQPGEHLVGRHAGQAERVAGDPEDHEDLGERGAEQQQRRRHRQDREAQHDHQRGGGLAAVRVGAVDVEVDARLGRRRRRGRGPRDRLRLAGRPRSCGTRSGGATAAGRAPSGTRSGGATAATAAGRTGGRFRRGRSRHDERQSDTREEKQDRAPHLHHRLVVRSRRKSRVEIQVDNGVAFVAPPSAGVGSREPSSRPRTGCGWASGSSPVGHPKVVPVLRRVRLEVLEVGLAEEADVLFGDAEDHRPVGHPDHGDRRRPAELLPVQHRERSGGAAGAQRTAHRPRQQPTSGP